MLIIPGKKLVVRNVEALFQDEINKFSETSFVFDF